MYKGFLNHHFGQFTGTDAEVTARPKGPCPASFLDGWKFFKNSMEVCPMIWRIISDGDISVGSGHKDVDMILLRTPRKFEFQTVHTLDEKIASSQDKITLQNMIAILPYP